MEFLTTINEGDEHVSLGDVLALRDSCLSESELWAVCRECCLALQGIHVSSDIFQTLCITPDAMCFDQGGTVCFLDLYIDPEPMYVPPEYEKMGNSYKSHLYSLGMTLLFAAEYNVSMAGTRQFSTELGHTINKMTLDDLETRASLEYVLGMCDKYLGEQASDGICQQIVSVAQSDTSCEDDRLSSDIDQLLPLDTPTSANHLPHLSPSLNLKHSFSRKRASPVDVNDQDIMGEAFDASIGTGGSVDPHSRRNYSDSHVTSVDSHVTPPKVKKKRDPLEKILRTTFIEGEDSFEQEELNKEGKTESASLEDITLLPPISNDLDLLQWDSDFLLSSYGNTNKPSTSDIASEGMAGKTGTIADVLEVIGGSQEVEKTHNDIEGWSNEGVEDKEQNLSEVGLNEVEFSIEEEGEETTEVTEYSVDPIGVIEHNEALERKGDNKSPEGTEGVRESQIFSEGQNRAESPEGNSDLGSTQDIDPNHSISYEGDLKATSNKDISCEEVLLEGTIAEKVEEGSIVPVHGATANGSEELDYLKSQVRDLDEKEKCTLFGEHEEDLLSTEQGPSSLSSSLSISQGSRFEEASTATTPTFQVSSDSGGDTTLNLSQSEYREILPQDTEVFPPHNVTNTVVEPQTINGVTSTEGSSVNTGQKTSEEEHVSKPDSYDWSCPLESSNNPNNQNGGLRESEGRIERGDYINGNKLASGVNAEKEEEGKQTGEHTTERNGINTLKSVTLSHNTGGPEGNSSEDTPNAKDSTAEITEERQVNTPSSTSTEVVTVKFNEVFGKKIHRDTSKDTLNQDISVDNSTTVVNNTTGGIPVDPASEQRGNVLISGDLNNLQNGTVVDSSKSVDSMEKSASRRKDKDASGSSEGQSVLEILDRLGCGFHENEVWALCRECVLAMQRNRLHLPAYVSLETVTLEDNGRVTYRPVPEDKELEVVFLAPELQKYGVITEKTCLFGVAAMLWSAADYRLPANQEPALSEELENLLISMTQDDNDLRPTAIEVLQTCNEYQKKQTTTSTQVCQALVTDAKKALDYGKGNSLVKDILEEQIENEVKSHKAEVVKVIQGQQPVTLKPASERTERPQVETEPTLHEKLMGLIRVPPRKLRRSSKPRVQTVAEIYQSNPQMMEALKRVTGFKQNKMEELAPPTGTADSIPSDSSAVPNASAFTSVKNGSSSAAETESGSVPEAFNSKATHFTPIVVTADQDKTHKQEKQREGKSKSKIDEKEMAEKIKKLKKNLMKNRLPLTLAADLENEVMQDKRKVKSVTPTSQSSHQVPGQSQMRLPTPPNVYMASPPSVPVEGYNPAVASVTPTVVQGARYMPTSPSSNPQVQAQFFPQTLQQTQLMSTSVPNLAYQYAPMTFQMGFQQDPRTGLFQLVPVPTAMPLSGVTMQPGMHASSMGQINITPPMQNTGQLNNVTPPIVQGGQPVHSPIEKQISTPSGSSTDGERPERKRHRKRQHKVKGGSKHGMDIRSNQTKSQTRTDSPSHSSSNRVSKSQLSSQREGDSDREIDSSHHGNKGSSDLSPVMELRAPVPRASSVDLIEKYENGNNAQPRTPRTVKMRDQRNKLKRTKSGSSVDFQKNLSNSELKAIEIFDDSKLGSKKIMSNLSRSQPNLDSDLVEFTTDLCVTHSKVTKPRSQRRKTDPASPELPSPPLSPSLSKDSGVSGMNVKTSDMSLMERLLNSDTIRHQQKLSRVVRIVRDEFAYDGYMENGIEDLAMAEYILSLGNLKWETFYNAVTEKYCDLYFEEDVVSALYEAVNGKKPLSHKRISPLAEKLARVGVTRVANDNKSHQDTGKIQSEVAHASQSPSAFRPIQNGEHKSLTPPSQGQPEVIVKPKPTKVQAQDLNAIESRQTGVRNVNLAAEESSSPVKESSRWHGDKDVPETIDNTADVNENFLSKKEQENSPSESSKKSPIHGDERNNNKTNSDSSPGEISMDLKQMSKLSYLVRQDSEASDRRKASLRRRLNNNNNRSLLLQSKSVFEVRSSALAEGRGQSETPLISLSQIGTSSHTDLRDHIKLSRSSGELQRGQKRNVYESETQLSTLSVGSEGDMREERIAAPRPYADMSRLGRGSVVYYSAEMQNRLRPDVKDFAAQIDAKTKESIESKMAEIEQQMMMEHKNKKKTLKYYRKLVETTKVGKITNEQRALLTRVGEQVDESNDRLDFLDAAKKHLEMLHAEHWGLDRTLLYALANCPGDSAMLLCACDNPLLQYQLLRSPRLGIEGQILQAGTPQGLMSYLFAQAALSEGFIHQFFYCYRYFTTPAHIFNFLSEKFSAAALSLAPGEDIPSKVKARSMDLLQVWIEGFFTVDFKDNSLMDDFSSFVQEKMLPVDESTELITEVLDRCLAGRHRDLYYPEFSAREDTNNNNTMDEMPIKKWESFKAALTGKSPKSKGSSNSLKESKKGEGVRRSDSFNLVDYSAQSLAEQMTLMEQALFIQSHPVHYLNSKYLGINVSLTNQVLHKADSLQRLSSSSVVGESSNLFAGESVDCTIIQRLIEHAQNIAFWVAAEIVSCLNIKTQGSILSKFIYIAKYCQEARNFSTCVAIVDGLENLIVRQLPVWKTLPSKCVSAMGELSSLKMLLKSDSMCLLQDQTKRHCPTIPSILYFLLHVQQLEIGGFTLANKMFRWTKMKSIANMIDQIRLFQQNQYLYTADPELQQALKTRMSSLITQDLPTLAQHSTNIPKAPSAGKLSLAFKKMSRKMKGGADS